METDFWQQVWHEGRTPFHQQQINPMLEEYFSRLELKRGDTVFVPMCGKSLDMIWLRDQGMTVLGVEISRIAVEAFYSENGMTPDVHEELPFVRYSADGIDILCGDFFGLTPTLLGDVDAVYDRASLIAFPMQMRISYAHTMASLLPATTPVLLLTIDYPQEQMEGPPFSVPQDEVRTLFADHFTIEHLHSGDARKRSRRAEQFGLSRLDDHVDMLRRRDEG